MDATSPWPEPKSHDRRVPSEGGQARPVPAAGLAGPPRPGPGNCLTDVAGIKVGHAQRTGGGWRSGVTVVLTGPDGMTCGADVRGGAPGTRETDLLDPRNLVDRVHAIVLTGGSAYGLAAADGVVGRLADAGVGRVVGPGPGEVVPIVPGAVIFDLGRGGSFRATPGPALGAAAYDAAQSHAAGPAAGPAPGGPAASGPVSGGPASGAAGQGRAEKGSVGAGTGALVGGLAGGTGTASTVLDDGVTVAALAVVNAAGSPVDPKTGELYGARFGLAGEFGDLAAPHADQVAAWSLPAGGTSFNTTIGVIATDAALTKAQCARLAGAGHDGLARAIRPAHTMLDGDTIFALASGAGPAAGLGVFQALIGAAADVFTRAIVHAILAAASRPEVPSYLGVFPSARRAASD